jgi:1-aminocyclopropane-1-carboxylate deaminase/D-cysteine desulfhydrase-like pyridoxal-dependent ACC family enzyme
MEFHILRDLYLHARRGSLVKNQNILFWHTGGTATLSAFANKL